MKPWTSICTLAVLCALMAAKFYHVRFDLPEIAWWGWPLVIVGGIVLNVGGLLWLAMMSRENQEVPEAGYLQAAAVVVLLLLVML